MGAFVPPTNTPLAHDPAVNNIQEMLTHPLYSALWISGANPAKVTPTGSIADNPASPSSSEGWYVESHAIGFRLLLRAYHYCDPEISEKAWDVLEYPLNHQETDGGIEGASDAFHTTSLYAAALADAILVDDVVSLGGQPDRARMISQFRQLMIWMQAEDVAARGQHHNMPFAHRKWLLAYLFLAFDKIDPADNHREESSARDYLQQAIETTWPDGTAPERGGFDVGYQAVSLMFAAKVMMLLPRESSHKVRVGESVRHIAERLKQQIAPEGSITVAGSTRTLREIGRSGNIKTIPYREITSGLLFASTVLNDPSYRELGDVVAAKNLPDQWLAYTDRPVNQPCINN
ncbi:hypothetical protein [Brevundimonas naejangsanensis]